MQASRIGEVIDECIERAGKGHEEAGQGERDPDVPFDGNAEEGGERRSFSRIAIMVRPKGERRMNPISPTASAKQSSTK